MYVTVVLLLLVRVICGNTIEHVLLTLTGDPTEMQISFRTTTKPELPLIQYGIGSEMNNMTIHPSSVTQWKRPVEGTSVYVWLVTLTLTNLTRGATYNYQITPNYEAKPVVWAGYSFKTLPAENVPLNIALYGDVGSKAVALNANNKGSLAFYASKHAIDLAIHYGDFAYNMDSYEGRQGDLFMHNLSPISGRVPYVVGPGNHEYMRHALDYYRAYFAGQATLGIRSNNTAHPLMYFSFDYGHVHFVMINTEFVCVVENTDVNNVVRQYKWLESVLQKASKSGQWIVVSGHRIFYDGVRQSYSASMLRAGIQCSDSSWSNCELKACHDPDNNPNCGWGLERLFNEYKVHLVFQGHNHYYKRHYPISMKGFYEAHDRANYINPKFPTYIISGAPGLAHMNNATHDEEEQDEVDVVDLKEMGSPVVHFDDSKRSWSLLTVEGKERLTIQQIAVLDGTVLDEFTITRSAKNVTVHHENFERRAVVAHICSQ